jgi:glucose-1-phosphate cytidylyltransferase
VKAVILCGGQGTRIRDVSEVLPKPMLPIGNKPIVWHIMKGYAAAGVHEFVLCLGYKGWLIKEFFINYRAMTRDVTVTLGTQPALKVLGAGADDEDWSVTLAETGESTMTGGRVAAVRKYLHNEDLFCLTYGDGVANLDVKELLAFHRAHGKAATVTAVRPPGRFGEMRIDGNAVSEFNEKPQVTEGYINGGFFVFDPRRIFEFIGDDPKTTLENEPMKKLADAGQLAAYRHNGFWQPMDTFREYSLLNDLWARGTAPWKTWA